MSGAHHIETLKFDFEIPSLSKNRAVQNRAVSLFNVQFNAMLNEVFDTYGKDININIEALDLKLEPVLIDNFEKSIIAQSRTQLIAYFESSIMQETIANSSTITISKPKTHADFLLYFLFNGIANWDDKQSMPFIKKWEMALKSSYFISSISAAAWNKTAIKRLVFHLNESVCIETINVIALSNADDIIKYQRYLVSFYKSETQFKGLNLLRFNQIIWEISLSFLLLEKNNNFSKLVFLKYHTTKLSMVLNYNLEKLLTQLAKPKIKKGKKTIETNEYAAIFNKLQQLNKETVTLPIVYNKNKSIFEIEALLLKAIRTNDEADSIKKWFTSKQNQYSVKQLWIAPLREDLLAKIIIVLVPKDAEIILQYHKVVIKNKEIKSIGTSVLLIKRAVWQFTLDYVFKTFHSFFHAKEFVKSHIQKLANHYGISHAILLKSFLSSISSFTELNIKNTKLLVVLKTLKQELKLENNSKTDDFTITDELKTKKNNNKDILVIEALLLKAKRTKDEVVSIKNWLISEQNKYNIKRLWIAPLREDVLAKIIIILVPKDAEIILQYHKVIINNKEIKSIGTSVVLIKRAIWQFTLDYMFKTFNSFFQVKEFVKSHIEKLSNHYRISHDVLLESLLSSVSSFSELNIKNTELLEVLEAFRKDKAQEFKAKKSFKRDDFTINDVIQILESEKNINWQQSQNLKLWLLKEYNAKTIANHFKSTFNKNHLETLIKQLKPIHFSFIYNSISLINNVVYSDAVRKRTLESYRKKIYSDILLFLLSNRALFNKTAFVEFQVKAVMKYYNINYKTMLSGYYSYLTTSNNQIDKYLEFVSIFNNLQIELEKKHGIENKFYSLHSLKKLYNKHSDSEVYSLLKIDDSYGVKTNDNSVVHIDQIFNVFNYYIDSLKGENAEQNTQQNTQKGGLSAVVILNHSINNLVYMINKYPEKYVAFLERRNVAFKIDKKILSKMNTSQLRSVLAFEAHYIKWINYKNLASKSNVLPQSESQFQNEITILFYLEEGVFPQWISKSKQQSILNISLSEKEKSILLHAQWTNKMIENWSFNILEKHKVEVLESWLKNKNNHSLVLLYKNLKTVYKSIPPNRRPISFFSFEKSFWSTFIKTKKQGVSILSISFVDYFLKEFNQELSINLFKNETVFKILNKGVNFPKALFQSIINAEKENVKTKENKVKPLKEIDKASHLSTFKNNTQAMDNQLVKWHLTNAGLIIAHPFLNHLFKSLKYLNVENKFKDEALKWRAVYLLHYLATGYNDAIDEAELAMSKILCGMEISEAIPRNIALNIEEKEMADELLTVLIDRWEKLGQTSAEGLRGTFLIREGILEKQENAYLLAVETMGVDILLDFIPWNISLIKLPWLNTIIYTTWR